MSNLEKVEPDTYKHLNKLEITFKNKLQEVDIEDYNSFLFLFYTFKDL